MAESSERLSGPDAGRLGEHLAGLTAAGLPLPSGLRALGEELQSGRLRRALDRLAAMLESGTSLDAALEAQGGRLPAHLRGLVRVGAKTGKIGAVLGRFAGYAGVGDDLRRSLWLRLAYPILSLALASLILVFACVFLISGTEAMFRDFGMNLPALTRATFMLSRFVSDVWFPLLIGLGGLTALWLLAGLVVGTSTRRMMMAYVPLIGPVWRLTALAEFCHMLGLMVESAMPLDEALPLAGEGSQDARLESAGRAMARDVASGLKLSEVMARRSVFPVSVARLLDWAERHQSLPEALHLVGEMLETRARSQARLAASVCSVLAVLAILGGIAMVISAVLIPMIQLISSLSG